MLVVADDIWRADLVELLRPPDGCGYLVTTRDAGVATMLGTESLEVGPLTLEEAIRLLENRSGRSFRAPASAEAERFCERLTRLALPIVLAGGLLRQGQGIGALSKQLHDEELRLSALDLDAGVTQPAGPDARRSVSIEACLGLSVAALDAWHRTAFYRLAILPGGELVDAECAVPMLAVDNAASAGRLLSTLASRGLVTRTETENLTRYGVHDLLLDYARTGFGPGRERVVGVPPELPQTSSELHKELLDRLLKTSRTGRWSDANSSHYYDQHLGWHMSMAGQDELLGTLLSEENEEGSPAWLSRARRSGDTSSFLSTAARAFAAACAPLAGMPREVPAVNVAQAAGASMALATIAAQASAIPVGILPPLVRSGQMAAEEALTHAALAPGTLGLWLMAKLLPFLSPARRCETWRWILSKAQAGREFAMLGDDEFLGALVPSLTARERLELLRSLPLLPHIVQARVLAKVHQWCRDEESDGLLARFVTLAPEGREHAGWAAGMIHLASCDVPTGMKLDELVELVRHCGPHAREAKKAFLLLRDRLAAVIQGATARQLAEIIEPFERHAKPLPYGALIDAVGIAELEADAGNRALLMSRLCALAGDEPPQQLLGSAFAALLALKDHDWRKADGLGYLLKVLPSDAKRSAEKVFIAAGATIGFGELGAMRLRAIARALSDQAIDDILAVLPKGRGFDRQVTLPALLEHAPSVRIRGITTAIIAEAGRSGRIGDLHHAARRIPVDLLPSMRGCVRQLPDPELVEAIRALSGSSGGLPDLSDAGSGQAGTTSTRRLARGSVPFFRPARAMLQPTRRSTI